MLLIIIWCVGVFFFFKQKTAYEMRISDWSSDVCSSDLTPGSGQEEFGAILLDPHIVGGERHVDAVLGERDMAVEDVERALCAEVDRQQLAAAAQHAAQDRTAGGRVGGIDLVQPVLAGGVDAVQAVVAVASAPFETAAAASVMCVVLLCPGPPGVVWPGVAVH